MDIMGPFSEDKGKSFILSFTSVIWCAILIPNADHTATAVAHTLMIHVMAYVGVLNCLHYNYR